MRLARRGADKADDTGAMLATLWSVAVRLTAERRRERMRLSIRGCMMSRPGRRAVGSMHSSSSFLTLLTTRLTAFGGDTGGNPQCTLQESLVPKRRGGATILLICGLDTGDGSHAFDAHIADRNHRFLGRSRSTASLQVRAERQLCPLPARPRGGDLHARKRNARSRTASAIK
jgi:hypothetical protein